MNGMYERTDKKEFDSIVEQIKTEIGCVLNQLLDVAGLKKGDILVVGCSTSEILGEHIGKCSSPEAASALLDVMLPILRERGIWLAAQCCEHLNRAIIVERECAEKYGYEIVNVKPQPKAGGSFATAAYYSFESPVALESVRAAAGIDVGGTLIGMHLKAVAVPVRTTQRTVGKANVICARTRPKYIGGPRAVYED